MARLERWTVSWAVANTVIGDDIHLVVDARSHTMTMPGWSQRDRYADENWTVYVIASANVGGFEPWTNVSATLGAGWTGTAGVGECR